MNANLAAKKDAIEGFLREIIMHNQARVIAVLESFGIYEYPSPEVVVNAYRMYGNEFLKHFHEIYISNYNLSRADGEGEISTAEAKKGGFSFNDLGNILSSAADIMEMVGLKTDSTYVPPAPAPSPAPTVGGIKVTNPLVIVGGLLAFLVVLLVAVKMLKKK